MVFLPTLDQDASDGFYNLVESLLDDIFGFAVLVGRVATHLEAPDYHMDMEEVRGKEKGVTQLTALIWRRFRLCILVTCS